MEDERGGVDRKGGGMKLLQGAACTRLVRSYANG
jgi:hypothetical protein